MGKKISLSVIIEALICVVWCAIVLIFAKYDQAGFYFWGGFGFGLFAFILVAVVLVFFNAKGTRDTTEASALPLYFSGIYLLATIVTNSYFTAKIAGDNNRVLVILNLVFMVAYISAILYANSYIAGLADATKEVASKIRPITDISKKLGSVVSSAKDDEVKKALLKLKEKVDFSSNLTSDATKDVENIFYLQLGQIQNMIVENRDKSEILSLINEADTNWNARNSKI